MLKPAMAPEMIGPAAPPNVLVPESRAKPVPRCSPGMTWCAALSASVSVPPAKSARRTRKIENCSVEWTKTIGTRTNILRTRRPVINRLSETREASPRLDLHQTS